MHWVAIIATVGSYNGILGVLLILGDQLLMLHLELNQLSLPRSMFLALGLILLGESCLLLAVLLKLFPLNLQI